MENAPTYLEQCRTWADQLELLEQAKNDGRGIEHVRWIIEALRNGDINLAQTDYRNQSDKYGNYPDIKAFLEKIGVAEKYVPPPLEED
ncbi:MAG: hypothetical protein ACREGR_00595 [Minisyncoccia bacterium]